MCQLNNKLKEKNEKLFLKLGIKVHSLFFFLFALVLLKINNSKSGFCRKNFNEIRSRGLSISRVIILPKVLSLKPGFLAESKWARPNPQIPDTWRMFQVLKLSCTRCSCNQSTFSLRDLLRVSTLSFKLLSYIMIIPLSESFGKNTLIPPGVRHKL